VERIGTPASLGGNAETWLVVFLDTLAPRRWWHRRLRPGYGHCLAFGYDGRCWLQVDCLFNLLDVRSFTSAEMPVVLENLALQGATCLGLEREIGKVRPRVFFYCVSTVKHLLGLQSLAMTPWQLYCALERRGARKIDLGVLLESDTPFKEALLP